VGFGDISAYNARESIFTIFYCYIATLTAQFTISNIVLEVTAGDESRNKYVDRTSKLAKYGQFRLLSKKLLDQCHAYYKYQHSILQGVDEHQVSLDFCLSLSLIVSLTSLYLSLSLSKSSRPLCSIGSCGL
jgi:hypothetical protein